MRLGHWHAAQPHAPFLITGAYIYEIPVEYVPVGVHAVLVSEGKQLNPFSLPRSSWARY